MVGCRSARCASRGSTSRDQVSGARGTRSRLCRVGWTGERLCYSVSLWGSKVPSPQNMHLATSESSRTPIHICISTMLSTRKGQGGAQWKLESRSVRCSRTVACNRTLSHSLLPSATWKSLGFGTSRGQLCGVRAQRRRGKSRHTSRSEVLRTVRGDPTATRFTATVRATHNCSRTSCGRRSHSNAKDITNGDDCNCAHRLSPHYLASSNSSEGT